MRHHDFEAGLIVAALAAFALAFGLLAGLTWLSS